jgi:hypothetical protein
LLQQQPHVAAGSSGVSLAGFGSSGYHTWNESSINPPESSSARLPNFQPTLNEDDDNVDDLVSFTFVDSNI